MNSYKRKMPAARSDEDGFLKLTSKQLAVYYWIISKAYYNSQQREDHYYIYFEDINYSQIARELGIKSINTVKTALSKLDKGHYIHISKDKDRVIVPHKEYYTYLDIRLIRFLLAWSSILGAEILLYYSILKRYYELNQVNMTKTKFNTKLMLKFLGHNGTDTSLYKKFRLYQVFLEAYGLIETTGEIKMKNGGKYYEYTLWEIKQTITADCEFNSVDEQLPEVDRKLIDELEKSIDFTLE